MAGSEDTLGVRENGIHKEDLVKSGAPRMESSRIVLANGRVLPERHVKGNGVDEPSQ